MFSDARHIESSFLFLIHAFWFRINESVHGILRVSMSGPVTVLILGGETPHAGPPTGTSTLTLVVTCECIPSGKTTSAFGADMWPLSCMKLGVPFQIVEPPEARLTRLADIRLLLAVGEQMTFEVMMPGELGRTVGAAVLLGPWGALTSPVKAGTRQTEPATRIGEICRRHRIGKGLVAAFLCNLCFIAMTRTVSILRGRIFDGPGAGHCGRGI